MILDHCDVVFYFGVLRIVEFELSVSSIELLVAVI